MEKLIYGILDSKFKKRLVIALVLLSLVLSVLMIPTNLVLVKMLPGKSANTFSIYVDTPANSSIKQTKKATQCVVDILKQENEIKNMEMYLGQGAPLDYAGLVKGSALKGMKNQAEIVINLSDKHGREEASYMMVHRIRPNIQANCEGLVKGTKIKFVEMPSGPPTLATIVVIVYTKDADLQRHTAQRVASILRDTPGLVDIDVMQDALYTKYEIIPDEEKITRSGLNVEQVNQILYLAFKGMKVAVKNTKDQQDQIPIFVRLTEESRTVSARSKESLLLKLSSLKLMNNRGILVPVKEVISVQATTSSPMITRKNLKDMVTITAECDMVSQVYPLLEARDIMIERLSDEFNVTKVPGITTFMFDLNLVDKRTKKEVLIQWDGEMKVSLDTFRDLGGAFIAALVLMFLLMVVYYKSFALSGIVLAGSFLSIIGVIAGHWVADKLQLFLLDVNFFLTATSLIGFISLMGISARSSLLLIDFTRSMMAKGVDKKRAIAVATATRAKPILLTAIAIILGSLLLATDPIFGGLGVALIFGSMAATVVSLFFIPVLMYNSKAMDVEE